MPKSSHSLPQIIFLNNLGPPTKVEARNWLIFNNEGLEKAFIHIEKSLLPLFLKQRKKKIRQAGGKHY